jgi:hypothetical protein
MKEYVSVKVKLHAFLMPALDAASRILLQGK